MKTAVRAAFVLAAVFFHGVSFAAWIQEAPAYFASSTAAQSFAVSSGYYWNNGAANPSPVTVAGRVYTGVWVDKYCNYPDRCAKNLYYPSTPGWSCPVGQEINQDTGECVVPPPEVDCAREAGKEILGKLSAPGATVCAGVGQLIDPNSAMTPENFVQGACSAEAVPGGSVVTSVGGPSGQPSVLSRLRFTGAPCSSTPEILPPSEPDDYPDTVCLTGTSGTAACLSTKMPKNCGTFNGQQICVDDPPSGNCTFSAGGNWACDSTAATPPKPAASPEFTQSGRGPTGQPSTVQIFPPGAEGGDANSTYTGGGGAGDGEGGSCGGEGQPACKIDEEGTPTVTSGEFGDVDGSGAMDGAIAAAGSGEGSGDSANESQTANPRNAISGMLPTSSDCGPIVWNWKGYSVNLDGYTRCAPVREGLAWLFGIASSLFILALIFRAPQPAH